MPLQQFDEKDQLTYSHIFEGGTYTPGTWTVVLNTTGDLRRFDTMQASNNDSVDHEVSFSFAGANNAIIASVNIPAGAGYGALAPIDCLAQLLPAALHYIVMNGSIDVLNVMISSAITSTKLVSIWGWSGAV